MSAPIPVDWWIVVLVVLALCVCCYGLGGDHQRRDDAWQIGYVLRENRHLATCVRFLFAAGELLMPEMEPEPEPGPTVRQRITARLVNTVGWVRARFRGPAEVEVVAEMDVTPQVEVEEQGAPTGCPHGPEEWTKRYGGGDYWWQCWLCGAMSDDPPGALAEPDTGPATDEMPAQPGPVTQPDMKQAATVAPLAALDDWEARQEAQHQIWLAEIRGETVKEGL